MRRTTKPRNRRITTTKDRRKQHIIKSVVKRRRQLTLKGVGRSMWRVLKVLILAAFVAGIYWGGTEGYRRLFWENPDYSLKEVKFETNGSLTREQAIETAGFKLGKNIFSYKLDAARERLQAIPQVASVEIRRYLPSRIELAVMERNPVAWVAAKVPDDFGSAERGHMIDAHGVVFQPRRVMPEYRQLPVFCGFDRDEIKPGNTIHTAEMETALDLLGRIRDTADFRIEIIDLSKGWCIEVIDQKGTRIRFGLDDLPSQLWRLDQVRTEAARYGQDLKSVNVMISRNIPVMFVPPPVPQPDIDAALLGEEAAAKPARPATSRARAKPPEKDTQPSAPPAKKSEPARNRETPKREGVLRPFRQV